MLRNFSRNSVSKPTSSTIFSRLRSSLHTSNPNSDRLNQTQSKPKQSLRDTLKSSITKSNSERKLKDVLNNKQNCTQGRSSSVKNLINPLNHSKISNNKKEIQNRSQKGDKEKLNDQFKDCVSRLDHTKHIHIGDNQCFLDYKSFIFIMTEMNYLNLWKEDSLLINEMWKDLGGQNYGGFLKSNLLLFLQIIEGITEIDQNTKLFESKEVQGGVKRQKIYNHYQRFRINKLNQTSSLSKSNSISKLKQSIHSQNSRNEKSFIKSMIKNKQQKESKNKNHITLKKKIDHKKCEKVFRVCFELDQALALKQQNVNQKQNTKQSSSTTNSLQITPKSIKFTQGSESRNIRNIRVPLLSLDVNLGQGKTDKIIVYESDTPKQIAQELAIKHSLTKNTCQKFQKILQNHLKHLLSKIQQVEQLTEDLSCSHRQI